MEIGGYSDIELNTVIGNFSIPSKVYRFEALTAGFINDTFMVLDTVTPSYILQRVNHSVFKNIDGLMGNIEKVLLRLDDHAYTKINLITTKNAGPYFENSEGYWRLMTYINETTTYDTTTDTHSAFEAGRIIAQFHSLLAGVDTDDFVDTIPRFHDLNWRKAQFQEAISSASKEKKQTALKAIGFANDIFETLSELTQVELPMRICHNDTKLNNILFSKTDHSALCLIDLDTVMKGHFYYDFGDAVRTIVNTAPEDERVHAKISFDKALFEAFVDGLASVGPLLSKKEIDTLHLGAIAMPFIHGIRALTDYLNGNRYYKVAYENQNLDRCLSLFYFTKKALEHQDYMKRVIQQKLG